MGVNSRSEGIEKSVNYFLFPLPINFEVYRNLNILFLTKIKIFC